MVVPTDDCSADTSHFHKTRAQFHRAVELIGRRWNGAIIYVLLKEKARFGELRERVPGVTDRMLTERLQELERHGIVDRCVITLTPVRVEYSLTDKGRALAESVRAITAWAQQWIESETGLGSAKRRSSAHARKKPARRAAVR